MPDWRNEIWTCDCGARFTPKRESNGIVRPMRDAAKVTQENRDATPNRGHRPQRLSYGLR